MEYHDFVDLPTADGALVPCRTFVAPLRDARTVETITPGALRLPLFGTRPWASSARAGALSLPGRPASAGPGRSQRGSRALVHRSARLAAGRRDAPVGCASRAPGRPLRRGRK